MACFVVLNGPRVDEVLELNPNATLTVGGGPNNHLQLPDVHVADLHAQVYPAEGYYWFQDLGYGFTLVNAMELNRSVHQLVEHDVLQLGRTFLRFALQPPAATGTGDLEELQNELRFLREEAQDATKRIAQLESTKAEVAKRLEAARAAETAAAKEAKQLSRENQTLTRDLERLRAELGAAGDASEEKTRLASEATELRAELELRRAEVAELREAAASEEQLRAQIAALEAELAPLHDAEADKGRLATELADLRAQHGSLRDQVAALEAELGRLREVARERDGLASELADLRAQQGPLRDQLAALEAELARLGDAEAAKARLEAELAELGGRLERQEAELEQARADDARAELASTRALLHDARDALAALGVPPPASELPRGDTDDLGALLDAADLAPEVRRRLEASLTGHVERETLRRLAGMAPGFAPIDEAGPIREELRMLHTRATRLASALGLSGSD